MRIAAAITLSPEQRAAWNSAPAADRFRHESWNVLASFRWQKRADKTKEVAVVMKITAKKVSGWRKRFLTLGLVGLQQDAPRPGRTPKISARFIRRVVRMTTRQKPH